jgi:uncharacterized protein YecE (DUF72 family)
MTTRRRLAPAGPTIVTMSAAVERRIVVGTASWTDPTLIKCGCFYPPEARTPEQRLRFYASQFPIVELDSSYYALPSTDNSIAWVRRTPTEFVFDVKAFRLFTLHQTPVKSLPTELREELQQFANSHDNVYYPDLPEKAKTDLWQRFIDALKPLKDAGKLGYVLIQLPPWATKRRSNLRHLEECADRLEGHTVAVEFRHKSWLQEEDLRGTLAALREQNLAMVIVDEPQGFANSVPTVWQATSPDIAVVRFHGRNAETWTRKNITAAERFNYLYSAEELKEFVEPVSRLAQGSARVHVMFNNCYEDKAQRNAKEFMELLAPSR